MLNADDIQFYRENGYLMVENAVSPETLTALRKATYELIERSREVSASNELYDLDDRHMEWHQDWAFYPHTNENLLALGLLLEDVDESNGPLKVIPGSHRGPVLSHMMNGAFCGAVDPADPVFNLERSVSLSGKA
jgi:ectoine hydroxylase-related dioxygenase (phytanoyl-CoA dioxygenase family)